MNSFRNTGLHIAMLWALYTCLSCNTVKQLESLGLSPKLLSEWKRDKNGCLNLRCKYGDSIENNKSLVGISQQKFLKLFGMPDDYGASSDILVYVLCTECDDTKRPSKETDSSWLVLFFADGRLEKMVKQIQ